MRRRSSLLLRQRLKAAPGTQAAPRRAAHARQAAHRRHPCGPPPPPHLRLLALDLGVALLRPRLQLVQQPLKRAARHGGACCCVR